MHAQMHACQEDSLNDDNATRHIQTRVSPELKMAFEDKAKALHISIQAAGVLAIEAFVKGSPVIGPTGGDLVEVPANTGPFVELLVEIATDPEMNRELKHFLAEVRGKKLKLNSKVSKDK
jgi:hypothetical protein